MNKLNHFLWLPPLLFLLSACSGVGTTSPPPPSGYLAVGSNYVLFIQFTETNNILSGEWYEALTYTTTNSDGIKTDSIRTFQSSFTAQLSGTQFDAMLSSPVGSQTTFTGSYDGNNVTVEFIQPDGTLFPSQLSPASVDDYNAAITALQAQTNAHNKQAADSQATTVSAQADSQATAVSVQATASALATAQNHLNYNLQNIGGAINALKADADFSSLLKQYSDELGQMQKEYQQEQSNAAGGCPNYGAVGSYDAGVQSYEAGIQSLDAGLQSQIGGVQNDISNLQTYTTGISNIWNNELGKQAPAISQSNIDGALQQGNDTIKQAQANQQDAQNKAAQFDSAAKTILQQADSLYNNMHC